jgi:predicted AlkP superfamily pyrophosphatase or phosphodiesterase
MRHICRAAQFAVAMLVLAGSGAFGQTRDPKLIIIVAVDQMRGDYVDRFQHQWSAGLKRLVTQGAWFRQADYPYFNTVTCAGHASISTGTVPAVHGMVLNEWYDQAEKRVVSCTEDDSQTLISYGAPVAGGAHSAARLQSPTLADELRLQHPGGPRVVSIAMKARSAINLAGRHPDVVTWLDDSGTWVTSTAFAKAPVPFVADYLRAHPIAGELGRVWDRTLRKEQYLYDESTVGVRAPKIGSMSFPHPIKSREGWESSPLSDAYTVGMALAAVDAMKLGRGPGTDFLGISFAALDKVGHDFGPHSHEVQDVLVNLDRQLGILLDKLDRDLGRDGYTLALSADHGVSPNPERLREAGFDSGRIDVKKLTAALEETLVRELGPAAGSDGASGSAKYVATIQHTDIYFQPGVYRRLVENPKALDAAMAVVRQTPGVWRVYRKETLLGGDNDLDPIVRAAARSYFDGRSGDLVLLPRAYWITSSSTTTHGTGHRYDTRVPVILFGHGIRPGQYLQPASPIDIAPTLAFLSSVTLSDPMGRVLIEALDPARTARIETPHGAPQR